MGTEEPPIQTPAAPLAPSRFNGPLIMTACLAIGQLVGLGRNILVSRSLGTEIQGQAMVIGLVSGFFLSIFTLNAAWQLVQSQHGEDPRFQSSLQGTAILRGLIASVVLAVTTYFVLPIFGFADLRGPMILTASIPLLEGLIHLDAWRDLRNRLFRKVAFIELSGSLTSTLAAIIALAFIRSIWVVPIVAVANSLGRVFISHLVAVSTWRVRLHTHHLREIFWFTLPLLPAGFLFWVNTQSDRMVIILSEKISWLPSLDLKSLGAYGTVAVIVLLPRGTIVKTMQSIVIPGIAATKSTPERCAKQFSIFLFWTTLLAAAIAFTGGLVGDLVFLLVLGDAFKAGASVAPFLIVAMGVQLIRTACYSTSTGLGHNSTSLTGNIARLAGLPLAIIALWADFGLLGLAVSVVIAELLASAVAGLWQQRFLPSSFLPVVLSLTALAIISAIGVLLQQTITSEGIRVGLATTVLLAAGVALLQWRRQSRPSG
ncbi:MAG: hypothetical protein CMJ23_05290 [Phycisphaerae bacterium]|nr:hypothetical protein [Phycisphaerae bacterium]